MNQTPARTLSDTISHRQVVAGLGRDLRRDLLRRSDIRGLLHLAGHLIALSVTGILIVLQAPGWPVAMLPHGILLVFLFCLLHEAVHETPFRSRWLNRAVAWGVGLIYTLPPVWFHYFHMDHHRYTHDPQRDPELSAPLPNKRWGLAWYILGGPFWIGQVRTLVKNALGRCDDPFVPATAQTRVAWEARLFLSIYAAAAAVSIVLWMAVLLWVWLVPMILGQPFLRLYLLAEHTGCPHVPNMLENTRTTFTNPVIRFFAWNMPHHAEHHTYPAVPFHQLPVLHRHLQDYLTVTAKGYIRASREASGAAMRGEG